MDCKGLVKLVPNFEPVGHQYRLDGLPIPSVTTILGEAGMRPPSRVYTQKPGEPAPADRGTAVHTACSHLLDAMHAGKTTHDIAEWEKAINPLILGYVEAFKRFLSEARIRPEAWETAGANRDYWFAGRIDLICRWGGRRFLIDLKTGQQARWHGLQLAAYSTFLKRDVRCATIRLKSDGTWDQYHYDPHHFRPKFLAGVVVAAWRRE